MKSNLLMGLLIAFCTFLHAQQPSGGLIAAKDVVVVIGTDIMDSVLFYLSHNKADWQYLKITACKGRERTFQCRLIEGKGEKYNPIFIKESDDDCPAIMYPLEGGKAYEISKTDKGCITIERIR